MYLLRISPHSRYIEIQYILYPLYLVQIQWIQVVSAPGPDTVDTYRTTRADQMQKSDENHLKNAKKRFKQRLKTLKKRGSIFQKFRVGIFAGGLADQKIQKQSARGVRGRARRPKNSETISAVKKKEGGR